MKYTTISIPEPLAKKVKGLIKDTGFSSVSDFTKQVLRDIVEGGNLKEDNLSHEEVKIIRKRLKSLGYL